jgi:polar amino acid transport system permease protein
MHYAFQFSPIWRARGEFFDGALLTLEISALATVLSLLFAIIGAFARANGPRWLQLLITSYVEVIRNTPFLVQIYFIYFGLPALHLRFDPAQSALVAMVLNGTAYTIEIVRAGIESVGKGQLEAARALGMNGVDTFRFIVMPQALRAVLPPLESQFMILLLASSVVSAVSVEELTAVAQHISSETYRSFEAYITAAVIYLAMSLVFSGAFALINRLAFGKLDRR